MVGYWKNRYYQLIIYSHLETIFNHEKLKKYNCIPFAHSANREDLIFQQEICFANFLEIVTLMQKIAQNFIIKNTSILYINLSRICWNVQVVLRVLLYGREALKRLPVEQLPIVLIHVI